MAAQGGHGAGVEVSGFVQVFERKVDHCQNRLSADNPVHSRGKLLVIHNVVTEALVDDDTKSMFECLRAAVVVRTRRINLKEICCVT